MVRYLLLLLISIILPGLIMTRGSFRKIGYIILLSVFFCPQICAQHNPGMNCIECHPDFKLAGTIFSDDDGSLPEPDASLVLLATDGSKTILNPADVNGNIHKTFLADGDYLIRIGDVTSRTWHNLPGQRSCNECHHFPATMNYGMFKTESVLNISASIPEIPGSRVIINGETYMFDPEDDTITINRSEELLS